MKSEEKKENGIRIIAYQEETIFFFLGYLQVIDNYCFYVTVWKLWKRLIHHEVINCTFLLVYLFPFVLYKCLDKSELHPAFDFTLKDNCTVRYKTLFFIKVFNYFFFSFIDIL